MGNGRNVEDAVFFKEANIWGYLKAPVDLCVSQLPEGELSPRYTAPHHHSLHLHRPGHRETRQSWTYMFETISQVTFVLLTWFSQGLCHSRVDLGCFPNFECSFSSPLVKLPNKLLFCLLFCVNLQEWTECLKDDLWDTKLRTNLACLSKYSVHSYLNCLLYFSFVPVHVIHTLTQIIIHIFIKCLEFRRSTFFNSELLS